MQRLFVYGTLKRGFVLHEKLGSSQFMGKGVIRGYNMYRRDWYPYIVPSRAGSVKGEVYLVEDMLLAEIDCVEEVPYLYKRSIVECEVLDEIVEVWVYIYNMGIDYGDSLIESGVFSPD